jgi:hypothetical protein
VNKNNAEEKPAQQNLQNKIEKNEIPNPIKNQQIQPIL